MEKQIIIRVHDITNDKPLGYLHGFDFYGATLIKQGVEGAHIFKDKETATLYYPDGICMDIGREDYTQKFFYEEIEPKIETERFADNVEQLLEDYKRRLSTVNQELKTLSKEEGDVDKHKRLNTKASCYRTFIVELDRVIKMT